MIPAEEWDKSKNNPLSRNSMMLQIASWRLYIVHKYEIKKKQKNMEHGTDLEYCSRKMVLYVEVQLFRESAKKTVKGSFHFG